MALTRELALLHTRAQVLSTTWGHHLSQFEADLIDEIAARRAAFGVDARISDVEETALRDAVAGLETSIRRYLAEVLSAERMPVLPPAMALG